MTVHLKLYVDGYLVPGSYFGTPDDPVGAFADSSMTVTWGRSTTTDQPEPSTCTFGIVRPAVVDWLHVGAEVLVMTAGLGTKDSCVFLGSITSMTMSWDDDHGAPVVSVIADDVLADLGNRRTASSPWPKESMLARVQHVLDAARQDVLYTMAWPMSDTLMAKQDVDVRMATEVLQQVSASVDAVLWSSALKIGPPDTGYWSPELVFEDTATRPALRRLAKPAAYIIIVFDADAVAAVAMTLDGCVFDRESFELSESVDDIVTGISVSYLTPDPTDSTQPDVSATVDVVDTGAENPSGGWGVRRISLDTLLTTVAEAQAVGERILGRLRNLTWRASTLFFDQFNTPAITDAQVGQLLDIRKRNGQAVIVPLPDWAPATELIGYLEGGTYTYEAGFWQINLAVAEAAAYGGSSTRWDDMPDLSDWIWNAWFTDIEWDDLAGVGPPVGV